METENKAPEATKSAAERLSEVEKVSQGLVVSVVRTAQEMRTINQKLQTLDRVISQLIAYVDGIEKVFADDKPLTKEAHKEAMLANRLQAQKAEVDMYLAQKLLKVAEVITAKSFVVYQEVDQDGKVLNPRGHVEIEPLTGDIKAKFMDKKVGDKFEVMPNRLMEILEVYEVTPPQAPVAEAAPVVEEPAKACETCEGCQGDCKKTE